MILIAAFTLSLYLEPNGMETAPVAVFPTAELCGEMLQYVIYDAACTPPLPTTAPEYSPRPKRNPNYEN